MKKKNKGRRIGNILLQEKFLPDGTSEVFVNGFKVDTSYMHAGEILSGGGKIRTICGKEIGL